MIISLPFWQVAPAAQAVEVLDMDMIAFSDVLGGDADLFAVFEDQLAQLDVADGDLVPIGDLAVDRERLDKAFLITQLHLAPIVDAVGKDRCDVVSVVYFQSNSGPSIVICSFQDTASTATPSGMTTTFASGPFIS